jgi:Cys-rich repeat protein
MHACNEPSTHTPRSAFRIAGAAACAIAFLLAFEPANAIAANACDEIIADPDCGCAKNETCDPVTASCQRGGTEDLSTYVEICHRPPGCPGNARTLRVSACAIQSHLGHGDRLGPCPECDSDDDCPSGEVCHLSTGICIVPNGPCDDDSDCGGGQVCNTDTGTCIDPDGPCDDDSDCGGGQVCDTETGTCVDPTDECFVDADCDDGLFCNGAEICNRARGCKSGPVACDDGVACTVDGCDENTTSCTHTPSDAACSDGAFCNGQEVCDVSSGCQAGTPITCDGEADGFCGIGACDEAAEGCVVIPQNDGLDCTFGEPDTCVLSALCSDGACVVTPLCDAECERCDPTGCTSRCGNPFGQDDDVVNATDALFTLRVAVELEECSLCVCDVTGDGAITATDTLMVLRQVVGLGDIFVCTPPLETTTTTSSTTTSTTTDTTSTTATTSTTLIEFE